MRPSIVVSTGALGAVFAAALAARPQLAVTPRSEILPALLPHLAALIVVLLAVYALAAIVLTAAGLIVEALALRRRIGRAAGRAGAIDDWFEALDTTALRSLAPAAEFARTARPGGALLIERRFDRREARAEATRVFYIALVRCHFFSALIGLAALAVLGMSQHFGTIPYLPEAIPMIPAALLLAGLVFLALLARVALDVTVEPLVETMARIPAERVAAGLTREALERLEPAGLYAAAGEAGGAAEPAPLSDRLLGGLEESHHALIEAVGHLSTAAGALAAETRSSAEMFQAMLHRIAPPGQPVAAFERLGAAELAGLRSAVEELTAALRQARASATLNAAAGSVVADGTGAAGLAQELKKLLQEM